VLKEFFGERCPRRTGMRFRKLDKQSPGLRVTDSQFVAVSLFEGIEVLFSLRESAVCQDG
jgi:hypothetical protein